MLNDRLNQAERYYGEAYRFFLEVLLENNPDERQDAFEIRNILEDY